MKTSEEMQCKSPYVRLSSLLCGALAICALTAPARAQDTDQPAAKHAAAGWVGLWSRRRRAAPSASAPMASFAPDSTGADALLVYDQPMFHI